MQKFLALVVIAACLIGAPAAARGRDTATSSPAPAATGDPAAVVSAAKALINAGHSNQAIAMLEPRHKSDPLNRDVAVALAQAYSYTSRQGLAIAILDAVLAKDPADGEARVLLGRAYAYNHDFTDAEAQFAIDLKATPGDSDAQIGLADTYTFETKYADAEKIYRVVLAKDPKNGDALVGLAAVESYTDRLDAARADYRKVLEAQPGDVDALVGLASVAYWQGDLATAQAIAHRAVDLSPDNGDARDILRQVEQRIAPLTDITSVTTTGSDGLQTNRQLIQQFYLNPSTYLGIYAARYEIGGGGTSTAASRTGVVAGFAPSAAATVNLRAFSSTFTGLASTTDLSLDFAGTRGKNEYGASIVQGGVDGSIQANGGVPVVNGRSSVIRLTTLALNGDHRFGNTTVGFALSRASYNDGNAYHDFTFDLTRTVPLRFGASLIADVNLRSAGFANSFSYSTTNPNPPYDTINHSHGYYDYLGQRDDTLGLTFSERFNDHLGAGLQVATGKRRTSTFYGDSGPTGFLRFEPYLSFDTTRMTFSVDELSARYSGSPNGLVIPYTANTLQLNAAIRL